MNIVKALLEIAAAHGAVENKENATEYVAYCHGSVWWGPIEKVDPNYHYGVAGIFYFPEESRSGEFMDFLRAYERDGQSVLCEALRK